MTGSRVLGYVRVSTTNQAEEGVSLDAQRQAIREEVARRGGDLVAIYEDTASGGSTKGRVGLAAAINELQNERADVLVVAKLDRLSRSLLDFAELMQRSRREGWGLIALDLGLDTSTAQGELMAAVLATFAQYERRLIGQRTRDALAEKRAQGVVLGRPRALAADTERRIIKRHGLGVSLHQIARELSDDEVPTARGGQRTASTVRGVLASRGELRAYMPPVSLRELRAAARSIGSGVRPPLRRQH